MNAKIAIGIVVILVLAGGIFAGVSMNSKNKAATSAPTSTSSRTTADMKTTADTTAAAPMEAKSFKELVMSGAKLECAFSNTDQTTAKINGTLYTNGTMMAGTYQGESSGMSINGHLVLRDGYMYTWLDNMPMAMKMKVDPNAKAQGDSKSGMDYDQKVNVSCKPWVEDSSVFTLPAGKDFQEISTTGADANAKLKIDTTQGDDKSGADAMKATQCAACNSLTGTSKTQCMSALGCK